MKYVIFISIYMLFQMQVVFAQQINNSGLENWQTMGSIQVPDSFYTFDQIIFIGAATTMQTSDAHSGQYAALLQTQAGPSTTNFEGQLNYGDFTLGSTNYFRGWPFSSRPDKLKFWYKFSNSGSDTALAFIGLSKWTGSFNFIGIGTIAITSDASTYTLAEVPITYTSSVIPDTILIGFVSSSNNNPTPGTQLYIDDIYLDYSTGISTLVRDSGFEVYPSITSGSFSVKDYSSNRNSILKITNTLGEIVYIQKSTGNDVYQIDTHLRAGIYFVTLENESKKYSKKIIIKPTF